MAENQFRLGTDELFITCVETASAFRVKPGSVKNWIRKKWLTPRYRLLGGRLQTVFLTREVEAFADWYLPTLADLNAPCERGSRHDKINRIRGRGRLHAKMASVASLKKHLGDVDCITQTEQNEDDPEYPEPAALDHGSAWRRSDPAQPPRGPTEDSDWEDEMDPQR